ncbi:type II secretion system protein [unidentified bacterial endosymbiont]|uniref:type II secretion system protein n=1 Tax=unidentified bacterial endosymbiont TaxID=2355 RepID=UPI00209ED95D|nr:shufflon system plasmid conjugative transfer pilus tip adhesin PilV [unidentified bacterial endosymbiont]
MIETIVVLTVLISLMSLGSRYLQNNLDSHIHQAVARHLKQVDQATTRYIQEHYSDFSAEPSELEMVILRKAGYLPPDFLEKNNYQQHYKIQLFPKQQEEISLLQVVITTQEGQAISEDALRKISTLVGGQAGYMSVLFPDKITGTQGGWEMEGKELLISPGHLASVTWVNPHDIIDANGFLRRKKIEGHPEYNMMETNLHMQDHSIEYENGLFTGKLSSNQLLFNQEEQSLEVSLLQGPQIRLKNRARTADLNSNQLSFGGIEFESEPARKTASWMMPSKVDANWNQVPFYERAQDDTGSIWKFADERCHKRHAQDFPQGRLFLIGRKKSSEEAGLFICSTPSAERDGFGQEDLYHPDHTEKLKARAYLISRVGRKYDVRNIDSARLLTSFNFPKKDFLINLRFFGKTPSSCFMMSMPPFDKLFEENDYWRNISNEFSNLVGSSEKDKEEYSNAYNNGTLPNRIISILQLMELAIKNGDYKDLSEGGVEILEMLNTMADEAGKGDDFKCKFEYERKLTENPW